MRFTAFFIDLKYHSFVPKLVANVVKQTMVMELSGIKIAATNGDKAPVTANDKPTTL